MKLKSYTSRLLLLGSLRLGLLPLGLLLASVLPSFASSPGSAQQDEFMAVEWIKATGETVSVNALEGDVLVASLFYTNCPNTCNLTIERFKQLDSHLSDLGVSAQFVLMSLDPENDTPQVLKRYRESRELTSKTWHFLTSNEDQVKSTARQLGYDFMQLDDHVFHRMKIFLLNPSGEILEVITMKTKINEIELDLTGAEDVG